MRWGGLIGPGLTWCSEQPVRIPDYDEPEPDVAIVRGSTEGYAFRVPGPADEESEHTPTSEAS